LSHGGNIMLAFQLVGLALLVLFFGGLVSGNQRISR
jgi:hypothetical protein